MNKNIVFLFIIFSVLFGIFHWLMRPISFPLKLSGENTEKFHVIKDGNYEVRIYGIYDNIEPRCFARFHRKFFDQHDMEANEYSSFEYEILKNGTPLVSESKTRVVGATGKYGLSFGKYLLMHGDYELRYGKVYIPCIKNMDNLDLELVYRGTFGSQPLYLSLGERLFFLLAFGCLIYGIFNVIKQKAIQCFNDLRNKL